MSKAPELILFVDLDAGGSSTHARALREAGFAVESVTTASRARRLALELAPAALVCRHEGLPEGLAAELASAPSEPVLLLLSGFGSQDEAVALRAAGAFDCLCEPVTSEELALALRRALDARALALENRRLRADLSGRYALGQIVSREKSMHKLFAAVEALSDTRATLLITGESGTGKSLLARTIHHRSSRAAAAFVEVNCGALPEALLESELFGHARGAFTGAERDKPGKFEAADGGTLFLDEIGVATPALQVKLLRVLQERSFERLGESKTRSSDVRVIAATNSELEAEVRAGRFREDLYYRLNVVGLHLPPLRERPRDVLFLAERFLARFAREHARPARTLSPAAAELVALHSWPGNVRELEHALERAVLLGTKAELGPEDLGLGSARAALPSALERDPRERPAALFPLELGRPLREALEGPEREIIRLTLELCGGSRQETARRLGLNRATLFNKMRKYGLFEIPTRAR